MKLIDKQKALDALMAERKYLIARGKESAEHVLTHHAYNVIDEQPIIESRPKGKWIYTHGDYFNVRCGVCGFANQCEDNFCPKCGADMRKETNKGETK